MRRVIVATQFLAKQWNLRRSQRQSQTTPDKPIDADLNEGLTAYANDHCTMESARSSLLEEKWRVVRAKADDLLKGTPASESSGQSTNQETTVVEVEVDLLDGEAGDFGDDL